MITDLVVTAHDGIELAVRDHGGDGPALLFLHGALRTLEDWGPVLGHLSGVRAVTMDLRSHGRSGVPNPGGWDDFVRDVDTVVHRLELVYPVVVGHSFGGVLAMAYAATYPIPRAVINVDGFDFREREILDEIDTAEIDRFIENFRTQTASSMPSDSGDDAWLEGERTMLRQMGASWKVPDEFFAACFDRAYVRGENRMGTPSAEQFLRRHQLCGGLGGPARNLEKGQVSGGVRSVPAVWGVGDSRRGTQGS